jgi:branched-chain amino acid transport system permease protein
METVDSDLTSIPKTANGFPSKLRQNGFGLAIVALFILFPFLFARLTGTSVGDGPSKFWQGQLITFFIMAVYAMSYDLLIGYTGILSFGHAAFFGGGAYTLGLFLKFAGPSITASYQITIGGTDITETLVLIAGVLLVIVVSLLLGLLFSVVSARVKGVYFAMISMAIAEALFILSKATDLAKWTGADEGLHGVPVPAWINPTQNRLLFYFVALAFCVIMYLFARRVVSSPVGRVFVALRENESRVRMIGYNPVTYRTLSFLISAVIAGLAGGFYTLWNLGATPSMVAIGTTINALIMTILGGIGTLVGPIIGAGLMQIASQFFYQWFGARWPLVFGLIFIALVMFLPYGIVGTYRLRRLSWKQGWQRLWALVTNKKA